MINQIKIKNCFKTILFGFFMLVGIHGFAQTDSKEIKYLDSLVVKMFESINNKDFDFILEKTHPKVFEIVPKDQMKSVLKSMFEGSEGFAIDIPKIIPKYKLSKIFKDEKDSLEYAFVSYDMKMKMTFHDQEFDAEGKKMMANMMKAQGIDIEFVSDNSVKALLKDRLNIFLKDDSTKNKWVMVNYDPDSPLFYQVLPSSLLEASKEYKQNLLLESKKKSEN